jgi:tetraacyldisaccharide 4'-kinase
MLDITNTCPCKLAKGGEIKLLIAAEAVYRRFYERRQRKFASADRLQTIDRCKVISVGNLTTGGTGKTPAVQWVARFLQAQGVRVAVVARGYGGRLSSVGAIVSDGRTIFLTACEAGDEPLFHAHALPGAGVVIGRDRVVAARRAAQELGAEVIVLDDGFQYWSLRREFDLILLDARRPFGNGHLLPRGRLREPAAALRRAHGVLLTRADLATEAQRAGTSAQIRHWTQAPVFEARHVPALLRDEATKRDVTLAALHGTAVCALSALADNAAFVTTLRDCGAHVVEWAARRDHHHWRARELRDIARRAVAAGATAVVTTEKDAVKLQAGWLRPLPLWSLGIELRVSRDEEKLRALIAEKVGLTTRL